MTAKKEGKTEGEKRRIALKIPKYRMYKDHGNHWCVHVALSKAEADGWTNKLKNLFSVHVEEVHRKSGTAYALYIHG
jgi:hypothetical protein